MHTKMGAFAAQIITTNRVGLAALAAKRLLDAHPCAAVLSRPLPSLRWREIFESRLTYLAAALSTNRSELFASHIAWAKAATHARTGQAGLNDLERALQALDQTLSAELPPEALPAVQACMDAAWSELHSAPDSVPSALTVSTPHGHLAANYLLAILEGDRRRASSLILDQVQDGTLSVSDAYLDVLNPVLIELGRLWHMNESTVAEEHFCTTTTQMVMSQLYPHLPRRPSNGKTVVAASVVENTHDLGIRMIADFLEMDGWKTVYLGASVPPDDLALAVVDFSADLLCLSAGLTVQLPDVARSIQAVRAGPLGIRSKCSGCVKVLVGGLAFLLPSGCTRPTDTASPMQLALSLGADGYASNPNDAVRVARDLFPDAALSSPP